MQRSTYNKYRASAECGSAALFAEKLCFSERFLIKSLRLRRRRQSLKNLGIVDGEPLVHRK